jgi:hypothetical protein
MDLDPDIPESEGALETLLRDRRFGPAAPRDLNPWDFLQRWPQPVLAKRVWPIVSRLLVGNDSALRARALEFMNSWSDGIGLTAGRLAEVGEQHPELFGAETVDGLALRDQYARTASTLASYQQGQRLASVLRRLATDEPLGGSASAIVGEYDPMFVIRQIKRWGARGADWALDAARTFATKSRTELLDYLVAASSLDVETREQILRRIEQVIRRDGGTPTAAECRSTIGL